MANNYFQFKQFKVYQDKAAMKVGTDGVLIGAWSKLENANNILDIGTGTGLLALMAAQRNKNAEIVAIDIDEDACQQAYENFQASPWADRLTIVHSPLQDFHSHTLFENIISNPPYFQYSQKSDKQSRNLARHDDSLSLNELLIHSNRLSSKNSTLSLIIPHLIEREFINYIDKSFFYVSRLLHLRGDIHKPIVRSLFELKKNESTQYQTELLTIENGGRHRYTDEYQALTKDFYLAF